MGNNTALPDRVELSLFVFTLECHVIGRAADWKLDTPDWMGRMRITAKGKVAYIKLEDKVSGEGIMFF